MYKDPIDDELRQVERDVVEGERQLAAQEALIIELKRQGLNTDNAEKELEILRENQRAIKTDSASSRCYSPDQMSASVQSAGCGRGPVSDLLRISALLTNSSISMVRVRL